jgi:S-adenosylmethionine-diacylglycerol 3-amino-3-carboxypropyl transferase
MPDMLRERPIRERASFEAIRYGSVWEDADVLCEALEPVAAGGRLLSIASAGDNALALLTLDPTEVVAVDLSAAQLACVAIRVAAFETLDDHDLLPFLGVTPSRERVRLYAHLRGALPDFARRFWDERRDLVAAGVIHAGRFEAYFRTFRARVLPLVHPTRTVDALLRERSPAERRAFYDEVWDSRRWRFLFRLFFSRCVMGRLGRDPAFFDHVDGPVASRILARSRHALRTLPAHSNPYLTYILTGSYGPGALPRYLRPEHRGDVRARIGRLRLMPASVEEIEGPFDGFNLSDVFEYMSRPDHERVYAALLESARPGARLVYWSLLAGRQAPPAAEGRARPLTELARGLHERDAAWFYESLHVDELIGGGRAAETAGGRPDATASGAAGATAGGRGRS